MKAYGDGCPLCGAMERLHTNKIIRAMGVRRDWPTLAVCEDCYDLVTVCGQAEENLEKKGTVAGWEQ